MSQNYSIELNRAESTVMDAFIEAFYWADTGEDGQPDSEAELAEDTKRAIAAICVDFVRRASPYINPLATGWTWGGVGHDLYLTSQRHGVGFWDRGDTYGQHGDLLTALSQSYGIEGALYQGDDGLIYI